jgi:hypothetical protein
MEKSLIIKHFWFERLQKSTIYSIIDRVDNVISLNRKLGSGRSEGIYQKFKDKIIERNRAELLIDRPQT